MLIVSSLFNHSYTFLPPRLLFSVHTSPHPLCAPPLPLESPPSIGSLPQRFPPPIGSAGRRATPFLSPAQEMSVPETLSPLRSPSPGYGGDVNRRSPSFSLEELQSKASSRPSNTGARRREEGRAREREGHYWQPLLRMSSVQYHQGPQREENQDQHQNFFQGAFDAENIVQHNFFADQVKFNTKVNLEQLN